MEIYIARTVEFNVRETWLFKTFKSFIFQKFRLFVSERIFCYRKNMLTFKIMSVSQRVEHATFLI